MKETDYRFWKNHRSGGGFQRPDDPARFGSVADARGWAQPFFQWYNHEHYHTGLNLMMPALVYHGSADTVRDRRSQILQTAYVAYPEPFVWGVPVVPTLPHEVWINKPCEVFSAAEIAQ